MSFNFTLKLTVENTLYVPVFLRPLGAVAATQVGKGQALGQSVHTMDVVPWPVVAELWFEGETVVPSLEGDALPSVDSLLTDSSLLSCLRALSAVVSLRSCA